MEALLHEEASQQEGRRNEQLAMALVERVRVNKVRMITDISYAHCPYHLYSLQLPEEVLHEATLRKYDAVLRELKRGVSGRMSTFRSTTSVLTSDRVHVGYH